MRNKPILLKPQHADLGEPKKREYGELEGTTRVESLGQELSQVLDLAAKDAHHDFRAIVAVRPAEAPVLNHLGSTVEWVDYRIVLEEAEVGKRHRGEV